MHARATWLSCLALLVGSPRMAGAAGPLAADVRGANAAAQPLPDLPAPPPPPAPAAPPSDDEPPPAPPASPSAPPSAPAPAGHEAAPYRRLFEGFYLRLQAGLGYVGAWGRGPNGNVSVGGPGPAFGVGLGGSVIPGLTFAAALHANAATARHFHGSSYEQTTSPDADVGLVTLALLVDWYPNPAAGWHVGGQIGEGGVFVDPHATSDQLSSAAFGGALFGGYDWRIAASRWALGLIVVASGAVPAELQNSHNFQSGYRMQGFALSVESTVLFF